MNSKEQSPPTWERELRAWLDALNDAPEKPRAAAQLARLGIWTRGSILPRGTLWAAATNRLPEPARVGSVVSVLNDNSDPEAQAQAAMALGEWGGAEVVAPVGETLSTSQDESVQEHCIGALGVVGGPLATRALLSALRHTDRSSVALSILDAIEELLVGGRADRTDSAFVVVEPPKEFAPEFLTLIEEIRAAMVRFAETASLTPRLEGAGAKARDVLALLGGAHDPVDTSAFSMRQLEALLAEIDRLPATRVGTCPGEDVLTDFVMDDLEDTSRAQIEAHLPSCSKCLGEVERTIESQRAWQTTQGWQSITARIVLIEAVELLSSVQFDRTHGVSVEGARAAMSIQVSRRDPRTRVVVACHARNDVGVNWTSVGLLLTGGRGEFAPPFLDSRGRTEFDIEPSVTEPFRLNASLFSVALDVPRTVAHAASANRQPANSVARAVATSTDGPVVVRVTQHSGGRVKVRVEAADEALHNGSAHLEFRGPTGIPLDFKTVTGGPVRMTIQLTRQEGGTFFGEWMAAVKIPEGTTLHVVAFPRRAP